MHWITIKSLVCNTKKWRKEGKCQISQGKGRRDPAMLLLSARFLPHYTPNHPESAAPAHRGGALPFVSPPLKHSGFGRELSRLQREAVLNTLSQKTDCAQASGGSTVNPLYLQLPHTRVHPPQTENKREKPSLLRLYTPLWVNNVA